LTQILISKKFEKEIVFESSVLAWIRIRFWIRIEQKCWIRIHIKSIRIHNPGQKNRYGTVLKRLFSIGADCGCKKKIYFLGAGNTAHTNSK
jgi:hypothetical protein